MSETRRKIIERLFSSFCYDVCSTCGLPGVHVVEDAVGGELEPVVAADVVVEHLELRLALVELSVVAFLQRDPRVGFVHFDCKNISNTLHLERREKTHIRK